VVLATGDLWLLLLQFPLANLAMCVLFARTAGGSDPLVVALAVLMVTEPVNVFLLLTTPVTVGLVVAGTGASVLWFRSVLRSLRLRLRFAQPEPGS
jgi:hypothetical protein